MSILPAEYPSIYFGEENQWVSEEYFEQHGDYITWERSHMGVAWDKEFLVIFATRKRLGEYNMDKNYSIIAAEIGIIKSDMFIHNMELLEVSDSLLRFNPQNQITKRAGAHPISRCYQKYERFFVGQQEVISSLKRFIIEIADEEWYNTEIIEPF